MLTAVLNPGRAARLNGYVRRHGLVCMLLNVAARSRLGLATPHRASWPLWRVVGPALTRHEIHRWHETPPPRPVLNLGGGGNRMPGTLTLDLDPRADAFLDVSQPLPFADQSADRIFLEEVIEHIPLESGRQLLAECYRILAPGGVVRITTPDPVWFFASNDCDALNLIFYGHGHRYLYTRARLREECERAGFVYRASSYREPGSRLGHLDTHPARFGHSPDISQYIELSPDPARIATTR